MTGFLSTLRAWRSDRRGVAALEFALVAPLLTLTFGITVEVGRLLMVQNKFETAVIGVARHVARYPEYEKRAREYALPVANSIFPGTTGDTVNIRVDSLVKEGGVLKNVFPGHVLMGSDPGISWTLKVKGSDYVDEESVIFVSASYDYKPLIPFVHSLTYRMTKDLVILPSYGRSYIWNDGQVDDSQYVY